MDTERILRKLAKTNKWQTIYAYFKEGGGLNLFSNSSDYSNLQLEFLYWLGFYHNLYTDIALSEIYDTVLEHTIYEDAYVIWKREVKDKQQQKQQITAPKEQQKKKSTGSTWVFKSKKRK